MTASPAMELRGGAAICQLLTHYWTAGFWLAYKTNLCFSYQDLATVPRKTQSLYSFSPWLF